MTVEFYGLKLSPPCWAVLNLGHHMGLEFDFHEVNVMTGEQFGEDFLKVTYLSSLRPICGLVNIVI